MFVATFLVHYGQWKPHVNERKVNEKISLMTHNYTNQAVDILIKPGKNQNIFLPDFSSRR